MAYKVIIPKNSKNGRKVGDVIVESLDATSCNVVQEVSHQYTNIRSISPIDHGDDVPVHDSIHIVE